MYSLTHLTSDPGAHPGLSQLQLPSSFLISLLSPSKSPLSSSQVEASWEEETTLFWTISFRTISLSVAPCLQIIHQQQHSLSLLQTPTPWTPWMSTQLVGSLWNLLRTVPSAWEKWTGMGELAGSSNSVAIVSTGVLSIDWRRDQPNKIFLVIVWSKCWGQAPLPFSSVPFARRSMASAPATGP